MIPENAYICRDGHVTEADQWDYTNVVAQHSGGPVFDYTKLCRRMVNAAPPLRSRNRCACPVVLAAQVPAAYAAFLIGGEPAAREIMIQVADGQAST